MVSRAIDGRGAHRRALLFAAILALVGALLLGLTTGSADAAKKSRGVKVKVMIRNLYLGANLRPALDAVGCNDFIDTVGEIANQVDRTDFPKRAKALAAEILSKNPDLVGLQEVSLWRTAPTNFGVVGEGPSATTVEYDFLQLLLDELNRGGQRYEVVVVKNELDFETPVNDDGQGSGCAAADHNVRLTQRDVILAKVGKKVKTSNPTSGTFSLLFQGTVAGVPVNSTRGWTAVDAKVKGSKEFHFVNTHLEAFDDTGSNGATDGNKYGKGQIRKAQAVELVGPGGPAQGKRVILVGDLNSDDDTVENNGDRDAYLAVLAGGFSERVNAKSPPLSCCLKDDELVSGSLADFDHQVDHILVNTKKIRLVKSSFTGLAPVSGLWPSDHAGVFSVLRVPGKKKK